MIKTLVNASVKYEILTERGILSRCGELVAAVLDKCRLLMLFYQMVINIFLLIAKAFRFHVFHVFCL